MQHDCEVTADHAYIGLILHNMCSYFKLTNLFLHRYSLYGGGGGSNRAMGPVKVSERIFLVIRLKIHWDRSNPNDYKTAMIVL